MSIFIKIVSLILKCVVTLPLSLTVASEPSLTLLLCEPQSHFLLWNVNLFLLGVSNPRRITSWLVSSEILFFLSHPWSTVNTQKRQLYHHREPPDFLMMLAYVNMNDLVSTQTQTGKGGGKYFAGVHVLSDFSLKCTSVSSFEKYMG